MSTEAGTAENRTRATPPERDHGGGPDATVANYGGTRAGWIGPSTGIGPVGGTRPDETGKAGAWQDRLARAYIRSRLFACSGGRARIETAL